MSEASEPDQVPVHVAVNRVARDIGAISKGRTMNQGQSYKFRGIEDVMNALHPILVEHGVIIVPQAREAKFVHHTRTKANGDTSVSTSVQQLVDYLIVGPMGDTIDAGSFGEGYDVSDKATNKSTSSALKYLLTTVFSIPTEDWDDPDHESVPIEAGTQPEVDRWQQRRDDMRERIGSMPDEQQQLVVAFLREHTINLRRKTSKPHLDRVEAFIASLSQPTAGDDVKE